MSKTPQVKVPPHNTEAEQTVLGGVLIDKDAIHRVADILIPEDFYSPVNEKIYSGILELYTKHQPIDVLTLTNFLKENNSLKDVGGSGYLAELTSYVSTASNIEHFAQIVKEKKVLRDLIRASSEIAENAFQPGEDIQNMLGDIEQKILSISQKSLPQNFISIQDELKTAYERIERLSQGGGLTRGVPTGFPELDNILSGFQNSDLVIVGARPSLGKTTFALNVARYAALHHQMPVGIFSLEMSREQIVDRIISAESGVPLWKLRTGKITDDMDFQMIQASLDKLSNAPIYVDDTPSPNILQMRAMARRLQVEHGLAMIIVDYLQLINPRNNRDSVVQQVTEISRGLKALARELNIPVVAVSQLSRAVDQRDNKVPRLSDLRESGSIEQDADVVIFLYRKDRGGDQYDLPPEEHNIAEVHVAKHRNGPLGMVKVKFDPDRVSFTPIETRYQELEV